MFSNNQTADVSLNVPVRAMDAVRGDKVESRFIAGSCSVQEGDNNHLHVLRYHSEANQLIVDAVIPHSTGPIAGISTSPSDKCVVLTYAEDAKSATLWKVPPEVMNRTDDVDFDDLPPSTMDMEESAKLKMKAKIVDMAWRGASDEEPSAMGDVVTLDEAGNISQWDVAFGSVEASRHTTTNVDGSKWNLPPRMAWDPHSHDAMAVSSGNKVHLVDWRTSMPEGSVQSFQCHRYGITDLDYNPNKPHVLTTAGQDGLLKFWDLRFSKQPILVSRGGHRHWVSRVSYNPFHDQLLLSAGTDSLVNLWRFSTISSAPLLTLEDDADDKSDTSGPNVRVSQHEHMDSVYAVAWGATDAWVYASVGYDGKAVLSQVPSKEKYKILL
jgi:hypothetical protein